MEVLGLQRSQSRERSKIAGMARQSANLQKILLVDRLFRPNFPYLANLAEPRRKISARLRHKKNTRPARHSAGRLFPLKSNSGEVGEVGEGKR
jgi:hypothetical protein